MKKAQLNIHTSWKANFRRYKAIYFLALVPIIWYGIFRYAPMYSVVIAFQNYKPARGVLGSAWVGLKHFRSFFSSIYAERVIWNTLRISLLDLTFGFPAPILFALLLNEVRRSWFKRTIQTITYIPHFISTVVICGILIRFLSSDGVITQLLEDMGFKAVNWLTIPEAFDKIYVGSSVWQGFGWGSIIYLAALTSIDPQLYEAATIDGAGRWKQTIHITIPGIASTIITLLILRMGNIMSIGYEKIILLYTSLTYKSADVISSYVYRRGIVESDYSFSSAVGLFNSVINCVFLFAANAISRRVRGTGLW